MRYPFEALHLLVVHEPVGCRTTLHNARASGRHRLVHSPEHVWWFNICLRKRPACAALTVAQNKRMCGSTAQQLQQETDLCASIQQLLGCGKAAAIRRKMQRCTILVVRLVYIYPCTRASNPHVVEQAHSREFTNSEQYKRRSFYQKERWKPRKEGNLTKREQRTSLQIRHLRLYVYTLARTQSAHDQHMWLEPKGMAA